MRIHLQLLLNILVLVFLAGCGGGASSTVNPPPGPAPANNPRPAITTFSPDHAVVGGAAFTLTINGTNFVSASTVNFGGAAPTTTFVNSTQLTAAIPAASITSTGTVDFLVVNPAPGGGSSNPLSFPVVAAGGGGPGPVPVILSFYPGCVPAGEQFIDAINNQLTLGGDNFLSNSIVLWNGADRPTTLDSNSAGKILTAQIPASDIATAGTATITVVNPPPGGGTSNPVTITVTPGGVGPQSIAVDPAGKFAYVADAGCNGGASGYVSMYTIDPATGTLTPIAPPVSSQDYNAESVTVDPVGKFAYVANAGDDYSSDGSVSMYTFDATTGALTFTGAINGNCPGLCVPVSVAVDPSGKFAYVPNGGPESNNVAMYTIDATTGAFTPTGTILVEGYAVSVAVHPSGKFAYVATASNTIGAAGSVSMFTINATTGALTSIGTIAAGILEGSSPASLVIDPTGAFAYVANSGSNNVSMYSINTTTGALSSVGTIAAGTTPLSVALDPAGKFVYVLNSGSNDLSMYAINATTGALTSMGTIAAGSAPTSITVHPSGNFAYVTNSGSNDVSIYSIDAATGLLTLIGTIGT
jgi:6-phosphogluconolactonase